MFSSWLFESRGGFSWVAAHTKTTPRFPKEAETLYKNMVKRFRQDRSVWLGYGTFLLRRGQNDAAHSVLQRALRSLPDKERKISLSWSQILLGAVVPI